MRHPWRALGRAGIAMWVATALGVQSASTGSRSLEAVADGNPGPAPAVPRVTAHDDSPFAVGERATYDVKFGILHVGSGSMRVAGIERVRDHEAWHTVFDIKGGTIFYHVNDTLESWFDTRTLSSIRFIQHLDEGGHNRTRDYEIYPERSAYVLNNKPEQPSVPDPLDDGSFLYFVRTLPLVVGDTYTFNRYFNPKANPVTIRVLRRERIRVPAGTYDAIVVQPIIKSPGIFSKDGQAHVWFSDDSARVVLQMKSKLSFGSLDLYLRSYQPGRGGVMPLAKPDPSLGGAPTAAPESTTAPVDTSSGQAPPPATRSPPLSSRR